MTDSINLGDPSSWCDSRCDRCPLLEGCEVGRRVVASWRADGRDDVEVALSDVARELERALALVAEECERRGVEPDELPSDFGMSPLVKEAERLGAELVDAADALSPPQSEWEEGLLAAVVGGACLMATKTVRIARELGEAALSPETAGVLLLLEHTRRSVDIAVAQLPRRRKLRARFREVEEELWFLVGPLLARVSAEARRELQALILIRRAPSPFCTTIRWPDRAQESMPSRITKVAT
jgi:hypothetical protein